MSKTSKYMVRFDFIEDQLLNLGKNYNRELEIIKNPNSLSERSSLVHSKRIDYLHDLLNAINIVYSEVNDEAKKIIRNLYIECNDFKITASKAKVKEGNVARQHVYIVDEVIELLGLEVSGKTKYKRMKRSIPKSVKIQVFNRDSGKCTNCGSEEKIHYHHITRFSKGGTHTVDNLKLLCGSCHAEEHKNERVYMLLKESVR